MDVDALKTIMRALVMSSPNTDALYRWKDPEWQAQRAEAINMVGAEIERLEKSDSAIHPL